MNARGWIVLAGVTLLAALLAGCEDGSPAAGGTALPVCDLPPLECDGDEAYCGELVPFEPLTGPGYDNYPINGETEENQYRSYLRRDLRMLIKYAAARVECLAADWSSGHGAPIGLGDMSEADGSIPGTSIDSPGHPAGTHEDGKDIDVAYYQHDTPDNHLRAVCVHEDNAGDAYHCLEPPHLLDAERTALFIGTLAEHSRLRLVIVDGQAGLVIEPEIDRFCAEGLLTPEACSNLPLAYEVTDSGLGMYWFFHYRMYIGILPIGS